MHAKQVILIILEYTCQRWTKIDILKNAREKKQREWLGKKCGMVEEVKEEKAMPCAQKRKERENCRLNVIKSRKLMSYSREYRLSATTLEVVVSYFQARI